VRLLRPLRERDFALLWSGMVVSLLGDGIFIVALPFAVLDRSDSAATLSLVGLAWSLGMVGFLLAGGVLADRHDKRRVLLAADAIRLVALGAAAALSLAGALELWHLIALALVYGIGEGLAGPALGAIVPELVAEQALLPANALTGAARPLALRLAGPALGGLVVAVAGTSGALLFDAATFLVSMACLLAIRSRPIARGAAEPLRAQLIEAAVFVRSQTWLWATLVAAAIALLVFMGPVEVLLPFRIKEELGASAGAFGLVLAANGAGAAVGAGVVGQRGTPRRPITFLYWAWGLATLALVGYGLATAVWQLLVFSLVFGFLSGLGNPVWSTLMQVRVPAELRGRVSSLDWLVSVGLTPLSFALTGPVAAAAGAQATLVGAGILGTVATFALLYGVPGLRDDQEEASSDARSAVNVG
jgi:MFS family permease